MKKKLLLLLLSITTISQSSPRCLGHKEGSRFRKTATEIIECNCPCQNYPRSLHHDGYKCLICEHRLLPSQISGTNDESLQILTMTDQQLINFALAASAQNLYQELQKPKPVTEQKESSDAWMTM